MAPFATPRPLAPVTPAADRPTYRSVLAVREFRGLWLAQIASLVGDQMTKLAVAILIFRQTDSPLLAALSYAFSYLPSLIVGPAAGLLADILPRRRIMLVCDLARFVVLLTMALPGAPVAMLLALQLVAASFEPPFGIARTALLPDIVPGEEFAVGQSLASATEQIGQVFGLMLGGALVGFIAPRGALVVDAATFLVSALLIARFVKRRPASAVHQPGSYWRDSRDAARVVWRMPTLRNLIVVSCVGLGLTIAVEGLAVPYAISQGSGSMGAGFLAAAWPMGGVVGIFLAVRFVPPRSRVEFVRLLTVLWPLPLIATALRPGLIETIVLWFIAGVLTSYVVLVGIILGQSLDSSMRGRLMAVARALGTGAQGIGLLVTGWVADILDPASAVALAGVAGIIICPFIAVSLRPAGRHRWTPEGSGQLGIGRNIGMPVLPGQASDVAPDAPQAVGDSEEVEPAAVEPSAGPAEGRLRARLLSGPRGVYILSTVVVAIAAAIVAAGLLPARVHGPVYLTWWALAIIFLIAYALRVPIGSASRPILVSLSSLPIVLGLLLGDPLELLIVGTIVPVLLEFRRGTTFMRVFGNGVAALLLPGGALVIFAAMQPSPGIGWSALAAAFVGIIGGDVAAFLFIVAVRRILDASLNWSDVLLTFGYGIVAEMAISSLGLLAVAAMSASASYGWLLIITAALIVVGSRAYVDLRERHHDLGQLYTFKQQLSPLLPEAAALKPVLESALEILSATTIELAFAVDETVSRRERVLSMSLDGVLHEAWRPPLDFGDRDPSRCLSVPLGIAAHRLGTLSVFDRQGHVRGFRRTDLRLLETLAAQVADALERGLLLDKLQDAATHDGLTGLLTLGEFSRLVDESLIRGESCVLVLIDVARLKDVNDSLGHEAGDALLKTVALRLPELADPSALLARSGGGEFAVLLPGVSGARAGVAIDRLAEGLTGLIQVLGVTVDLRTRLGWVTSPRDGKDAANLLRRADLALGGAKRSLQRSMRFNPDLEIDGLRRLRLVNDLRVALAEGELKVVYQPLIRPRDGLVIGAEALSRWNHPELGALKPDEFIMVAEQSGLIGDLTEYVLDTALAQARIWKDEGRDLGIAVNLSARCLSDLSLPSTVLDLLARHRIDAGRLTLEVTETSVAEDPTRAEAVLSRLRGIGVRLSIDDFGTGYSSLASLKRFPVQEVKLDRQFLIDLEAGLEATGEDVDREQLAVDEALFTAVVSLGHSLGLEIVAEGVETPSAYKKLRDLGVDILQGFYMGRPAAASEMLWRFTPETTGGSPSREMWEPPAVRKHSDALR